jgi:hypothetical protein
VNLECKASSDRLETEDREVRRLQEELATISHALASEQEISQNYESLMREKCEEVRALFVELEKIESSAVYELQQFLVREEILQVIFMY